ncbi:MAG: autotransporter outer membrane beta-barrel domain-containing protein [Lysobacterales bacterium]|nr:MAG: autotransporter outer membrane beta-barrel domain-containing protein [Xanthomonadales bacterium]
MNKETGVSKFVCARAIGAWTVALGMALSSSGAAAQSLADLPEAATNNNQLAMAGVIQVVCPNLRRQYAAIGILPADQLRLFDACAGVARATSGDDTRSNALQSLTGEELNAAHSATIDFTGLNTANIAARLATLRQVRGGIGFASASPADPGILQAATGGAAGDETALDGRLGLFLNGRIGSGTKDTTELEAGYDIDTTGFTAGVDYRVGESGVIGAAFGYGTADAEFERNDFGLEGGALDSDGYAFSVFGSLYGERYYVDVLASYGTLDHESERRIVYSLTIPDDPNLGSNVTESWDETAVGETSSDSFSLSTSFGYDFGSGPWHYGPMLAVSYLNLQVDGFTEKGAPGLELRYGSQEADSLQLQAGLNVGYDVSVGFGVLSPYARATYVSEQENESQAIRASYASDPLGAIFVIQSDEPDTSFFRWGVGVSAIFANSLSAFLDYDSVAGLDSVDYGEFTAGVRWSFR